MGKIFNAFSQNSGIPRHSLRFTLDGDNIKDDDTPESLDLESGDRIDAHRQQVGGVC